MIKDRMKNHVVKEVSVNEPEGMAVVMLNNVGMVPALIEGDEVVYGFYDILKRICG